MTTPFSINLTWILPLGIISPYGGFNQTYEKECSMFRPKNERERLLHRLKIVLGHYKKVMKMVEDDIYCIDVLHQSLAVQRAMHKIDMLLLKQHLARCVTDAVHNHQNEEKFMQEILDVFQQQAAR